MKKEQEQHLFRSISGAHCKFSSYQEFKIVFKIIILFNLSVLEFSSHSSFGFFLDTWKQNKKIVNF